MLNSVVGLRRGMSFVNMFGRHPECQVVAVCDKQDLALGSSRKDIPGSMRILSSF